VEAISTLQIQSAEVVATTHAAVVVVAVAAVALATVETNPQAGATRRIQQADMPNLAKGIMRQLIVGIATMKATKARMQGRLLPIMG
jgi:uncharacterized protein involved in high-affinity Fe2+ transport